MGSGSFGEDEADVAFLDFLLGLDETSYGVAVTVNGDASAYSHDEAAEFAVVSLEIGCREAAHLLEVASGQIVNYENAVGVALMVRGYYVGVILREILSADTLHVAEDMS